MERNAGFVISLLALLIASLSIIIRTDTALNGGAASLPSPNLAGDFGYTVPGVSLTLGGSFAFAADRTLYYPIYTVADLEINRMALEVTSGGVAGCLLRAGIYEMTSEFQPGDLINDAGNIDSTVVAVHIINLVALTLPPGPHMLAFTTNETVTLRHDFGSYIYPLKHEGFGVSGFPATLFIAQDNTAGLPDPGVNWDSGLTSTSGLRYPLYIGFVP
jgi:hypothetical protein